MFVPTVIENYYFFVQLQTLNAIKVELKSGLATVATCAQLNVKNLSQLFWNERYIGSIFCDFATCLFLHGFGNLNKPH